MKEQRHRFTAVHPMRRASDRRHATEGVLPTLHRHRERDFGIGYGNSSGYGNQRHFLALRADPLFRCR